MHDMGVDWGLVVWLVVLALLALWPAIRAITRRRVFLGAAYAVAGIAIVFALPIAVTDWWEAANPDQTWSMAPPSLTLSVSPVATVPFLLIGSCIFNAVLGWNSPSNKQPSRQP
jgi:hypothetical protein